MTILDEIIENKRYEVARAKQTTPESLLEKSANFERKPHSLAAALKAKGSTGIIAEYKRRSPSKGVINNGAGIAETTMGYVAAGAAGLSILTDTVFFGGFKEDLTIARDKNPQTPLLRKDFMIDAYQIMEAKALGADAILLIAAALSPEELETMANYAKNLGLEVLLEVHDADELSRSPLDLVDIVGVNNRNLKNFNENNVEASLALASKIPTDKVKISESCISLPETVQQLRAVGFQGFLIGESFMKTKNPSKALADFIGQL